MVLFQGSSKDQNVIQIYYHDALSYEIMENVVYHSLENSWAIGHTREYC